MTFEIIPTVFIITQVLKGVGVLPHKFTQAFVVGLALGLTFYLEHAITVETVILGFMYAATAMKGYEVIEDPTKKVTEFAIEKPMDVTKGFIGKLVK